MGGHCCDAKSWLVRCADLHRAREVDDDVGPDSVAVCGTSVGVRVATEQKTGSDAPAGPWRVGEGRPFPCGYYGNLNPSAPSRRSGREASASKSLHEAPSVLLLRWSPATSADCKVPLAHRRGSSILGRHVFRRAQGREGAKFASMSGPGRATPGSTNWSRSSSFSVLRNAQSLRGRPLLHCNVWHPQSEGGSTNGRDSLDSG